MPPEILRLKLISITQKVKILILSQSADGKLYIVLQKGKNSVMHAISVTNIFTNKMRVDDIRNLRLKLISMTGKIKILIFLHITDANLFILQQRWENSVMHAIWVTNIFTCKMRVDDIWNFEAKVNFYQPKDQNFDIFTLVIYITIKI